MNRELNKNKLKNGDFDLLVVGGGATGAGVALDAASRGLKVALIERNDFASETSSRSTKLVHGGVRYLEQAFTQLDWKQYELVRDALHERSTLLSIAPHLCHPLALLTPLYRYRDVPYFTSGLKLYDKISGKRSLGPSRFVGAKEALRIAPMLESSRLRGAVIYYDGQFNDARMNLSICLTAFEQGAVVCNYVALEELVKEGNKICGAVVKDRLSDQTFNVRAKVVVNATGPFCDDLRKLDDPGARPMVSVSMGAHLVVSAKYCPVDTGVLIPRTDDDRVLFLLPWEGHTLVGTTDTPGQLQSHPRATSLDLSYIVKHVNKLFSIKLKEDQILSSWAGLRPLVAQTGKDTTAKLSRDHVIDVSASGLLSIVGGKWTTYRLMAKEVVEEAGQLMAKTLPVCKTEQLPLAGGEDFSANGWQALEKEFGLETGVAKHLHGAYGSRAPLVGEIAKKGYGRPLCAGHPYLEAEVIYGARQECACTIIDILARRTRLSFIDTSATMGCLERVSELLASELHWDEKERVSQVNYAKDYFAL